MLSSKANIIARLQREILPLQGFKQATEQRKLGLGAIEKAFPEHRFPLGAVHEFICPDTEAVSASGGFISAILGKLMQDDGAIAWIASTQNIFPPALHAFGIKPEKIIFIFLKKQQEMLWAMEEALKCEGLAAVVAEIPGLSFTVSRRFQLAVEKSGVTGFIICKEPKQINTTACIARWQISSLPSTIPAGIPGIGFPRWNVELVKARNGKPGSWEIEYYQQKFRYIMKPLSTVYEEKRKTG